MVGVGLTGKIKPLNGAAFPVYEDIDGQGGWRSVATIADRNSFSAAPLYCKAGMICYVDALQCAYELAPDLTTWVFYMPSPRLASQAAWYVDPAGSVNNDGKTLGAPIPPDELQRRLFPFGCGVCLLTQDIVIHYAAASYAALVLNFGSADGVTRQASLNFAISSSAPITLTNVIQPNAGTKVRGQLTTGAGTFVNQERIRLTSGASSGAIAYSMGLNAGPQNTFCSLFTQPTFAAFHNPSPAAIGDTCVVDTLLCQVSRLQVTANARARVVVNDVKIIRALVNGTCESTPSSDQGGNVMFAGCQAISIAGYWLCCAGGANVFACRWAATTITALKGPGWLVFGLVVQGVLMVSNGSVNTYGMAIDGGAIVVGADGTPGAAYPDGTHATLDVNAGYVNAGSIEVENGPSALGVEGAAIAVLAGSQMVVNDFAFTQMWGNSGAYAIGYFAAPGGYFYQRSQPAAGTLAANFAIPAAIGFRIGGLDFAYSDNPIMVPNANAGVLLMDDQGTPFSVLDAAFYNVAQSGNVAVSAFGGGRFLAGPGMYRVSGYVSTTTPDAGAVGVPTLNVVFTDDSGVARTVPVAAPPSVTAAGGAGGEVIIESSAAGSANAIRWSVTGVVTPGTAQYSARCRVEKISPGP